MSDKDVIIKVDHMTKSYGDNVVLEDINTVVNKGDIIAIIGPSGCGKSTFIRRFMELLALPGMEEQDAAEVRDQLPVSGSGKTITTVEPKFIPREAVNVNLGEEIPVKNNGYVFVEGAYSCHPVFGDYMDRRVFLDIDGKTQEDRIRKRNGEDRLQDFLQLWIPLEEAYFQAFSVWEKADYIIL